MLYSMEREPTELQLNYLRLQLPPIDHVFNLTIKLCYVLL